MPCYNEAGRLQVDRLRAYVDAHPMVNVLLVNDGSSDGTAPLLDKLSAAHERISALHLPANVGKANAVQAGMGAALKLGTKWVGFLDADFDIPPQESLHLVEALENHGLAEFAFGSRIKLLNNIIERNTFRHIFGRVFATFTSMSLELDVYDTQCGVKVFSNELAAQVFARPFLSRWIFDVEIFWRVMLLRGRNAITTVALEVPLRECYNSGQSKIGYLAMLKFPFELMRIRRYYLRNGFRNG